MNNLDESSVKSLSKIGAEGLQWASSGGEAAAYLGINIWPPTGLKT
jgi:hypothetical protein